MIRISQGLAKIRNKEIVEQEDVEEALRLMEASRESVEQDTSEDARMNEQFAENTDTLSKIFGIIRDLCSKEPGQSVKFLKADKAVAKAGHKKDDFFATLEQYTNLNVLYICESQETITLL